MNYPPRLGHLATKAVVAAKLATVYAEAHNIEEEDAIGRLTLSLTPAFLEEILGEVWVAMLAQGKLLTEARLLEKVAKSLKDRPFRLGRKAQLSNAWSAFMLMLDLHAGTASEVARRVLETEEGRQKAREGVVEAGRYLAAEFVRGT